jgi:hypothetical protein
MLFVRRMLLADLSKSVSSGRLAHTAMDVGKGFAFLHALILPACAESIFSLIPPTFSG